MKGEIIRVEEYSYGTDGTLLYRAVARPAPDNDDAMFLVAEENLRRIEIKGFDSLLEKVRMMTQASRSEERRIAEIAREACIRAALDGYENAAMSGLCHEGAWEAAISAIRMLNLETIIKENRVK